MSTESRRWFRGYTASMGWTAIPGLIQREYSFPSRKVSANVYHWNFVTHEKEPRQEQYRHKGYVDTNVDLGM